MRIRSTHPNFELMKYGHDVDTRTTQRTRIIVRYCSVSGIHRAVVTIDDESVRYSRVTPSRHVIPAVPNDTKSSSGAERAARFILANSEASTALGGVSVHRARRYRTRDNNSTFHSLRVFT